MSRLGVIAALVLALSAAVAGGASSPRILWTDNNVWVSALDGSGTIDLTGRVGLGYSASWSPDGTRVAFATNRDTGGQGGSEIYVANADGTGLKRLTFGATAIAAGTFSPVWSPDGSRIAYGQTTALWSVPSNGGTPTKVADTPATVAPVAWSPDGSTVLAHGTQGAGELYAIRVADGLVRDLGNDQTPVYSPDGARIAFQDAQGRVAVMNADLSDIRELTDMNSTYPTWIDAHTIAFTGNHVFLDRPESKFGYPTRTNVYVVDVDGAAAPKRITDAQDEFMDWRSADQPVASPDGKQLLFRWQGASNREWRVNADGTCAQDVTNVNPTVPGPAWQPGSAPGRTDCAELWISPLPVTITPNPVALGRPANIMLRIENHGTQAATNVKVALAPGDATTQVGYCFSCAFPSIAPGGSALVQFSVSSKVAGFPHATVTVTADQPSPAPVLATAVVGAQVLDCTIVGTTAADRLFGTARRDRICGLPGPDWINGGGGNDTIDSGNGDDVVYGGPGSDTIYTRDGRDTVFAADGKRDTIDCGPQYDTVVVDRFDRTTHCEHVIHVR